MGGGTERNVALFYLIFFTPSWVFYHLLQLVIGCQKLACNQMYSPKMLVLTVRERCVLFRRMSAALEREMFSKF